MKKVGLEIISGPMFAGKTSELLRRINREGHAGRKTQVFKWCDDHRYGSKVVSHDGLGLQCIEIPDSRLLRGQIDTETEVVGIDEAQFFDDGLIDFCREHYGDLLVIATCLNMDFRGEPFKFRNSSKNLGELMAIARRVVSIHAVCTYPVNGKPCGADACYSQRLIDGKPAPYNSPLVIVGGAESYQSRCPEHFVRPARE